MRLLVVAARPPARDQKGDQVRLMQFLPALAAAHSVTLVYPISGRTQRESTLSGLVEVPVPVSRIGRLGSAVASWLSGRPLQVGWFAPRSLARQVRQAAAAHDAVLFVTARPYVDLPRTSIAVDHVDALSLNARNRGRGEGALLRGLWRLEARRLARWETRVAERAYAQLVTSPIDAAHLPPRPVPRVVPNAAPLVAAASDPEAPRDIDLIFTGNMRYGPNRDAAVWLADEIAPRLRDRIGPVRIAIVGRAAAGLGLSGVDLISDVPDLRPYLRRAKVAVAPLRTGTGVPNKVLEAARADAALVMTPEANAALGFTPAAVELGGSADELAEAAARLLQSTELRERRVRAMRVELSRFSLERVSEAYLAALKRPGPRP